jgi:hypothetical protein
MTTHVDTAGLSSVLAPKVGEYCLRNKGTMQPYSVDPHRYSEVVINEDKAHVRQAARDFAKKWSVVKKEKQYAQSFWSDFFHNVIGIDDLLTVGIDFEYPVKNVKTGVTQFIDVLWGGVVLIEHKSAGKNLDVAEKQARDYLVSLSPKLRPQFLIVSDFARVRIIDVLLAQSVDFDLVDLPKNIDRVEAVFGAYNKKATIHEVAVDKKAVKKMAALYTEFENAGYKGHEVSVFLVRILFLLFGDDTGMWKKPKAFEDIVDASNKDGSGLGTSIQELFYVLDTETRAKTTPSELLTFPHVNGGLFKEKLPVFSFNVEMREALWEACQYDWSTISPAIFGSMFQTVKSKEARRALGEHYTSEANILKVIRPLFLDDYLERLRKSWDSPKDLRTLRNELGERQFLDPACGSGNFLIITYKRLREIELKIIARLQELTNDQGQVGLEGTADFAVRVKLTQFHGIEYEEWSSQIATVAMFLADRQANLAMEEIVGTSPDRFPLKESARIVCGNALREDWSDICPMTDNTVIMGNPPFYGSTNLNDEQKEDQALVWGKTAGKGILDYVASWYLKGARYIAGTKAVMAFVSTNSISQGQQPAIIWGQLFPLGMAIDFAHRTFAWSNEAAGNASVYCVIIGVSANPKPVFRSLWSYATVKGEPTLVRVRKINPYLLDADDVLIRSRRTPIQPSTQPIVAGNKPVDKGALSNITPEVAQQIRDSDPIAAKYLKRVVGSEELISDIERWGLWLADADVSDLLNSPELKARIAVVKEMRLQSDKPQTNLDANRAWEWQETTKQPKTPYLAVPLLSSENRDYTPMAILEPDVLANNLIAWIADASLSTFGVLQSRAFSVWNKGISGRMKHDPRVSGEITYNNFPFPEWETEDSKKKVEKAAEGVIAARENHPNASLATLYNRNVMPTDLRKAHAELDKAVLNAYGLKVNATDIGVLEMLFTRYSALTGGLLAALTVVKKKRR